MHLTDSIVAMARHKTCHLTDSIVAMVTEHRRYYHSLPTVGSRLIELQSISAELRVASPLCHCCNMAKRHGT